MATATTEAATSSDRPRRSIDPAASALAESIDASSEGAAVEDVPAGNDHPIPRPFRHPHRCRPGSRTGECILARGSSDVSLCLRSLLRERCEADVHIRVIEPPLVLPEFQEDEA